MKKGLVVFAFLLVLSLSFATAAPFDFVKDFLSHAKLTGNPVVDIPEGGLPIPNTFSCNDTDGGIFLNIKGTVNRTFNNRSVLRTDQCLPRVSGQLVDSLTEFYCEKDSIKLVTVPCKDGCANGACLASTLTFSVATTKPDFRANEPITLTDPPSAGGSLVVSHSIYLNEKIDSKGEIDIDGYFVELHQDPLVVYRLEAQGSFGNVRAKKASKVNPQVLRSAILDEHTRALTSFERTIGKLQPTGKKLSLQGATKEKNKVLGEFSYLFNGFVLNITSSEAEKIAQLSEVKAVYPNYKVKISLDSSLPAMKYDSASRSLRLNGSGVTIAIIDTGIDGTHESLDDLDDNSATSDPKIIGFKDFVNFRTEPYDDQGHGTHVSGIAAGTGGGGGIYQGVASQAHLVGVKVLDEGGGGSFSDVIAGMEWVIQNKEFYNISIISMSLGANINSDGTTPVEKAANYAVTSGIVMIVAAGNAGSRGNQTVGIPASALEVIAVGAVRDDQKIASFSSRGPSKDGRIKPEVSAVGVYVTSSVPKGKCELCDTSGYLSLSGTSMATPHVAGLVALLLQADPSLTPDRVKTILTQTALDKGVIGPDNTYGYGVTEGLSTLFRVSPPVHEIGISQSSIKPYLIVGENNDLSVTLVNYGASKEVFDVRLLINDQEENRQEITLTPREERVVTFHYSPKVEGSYNVSVGITPAQADKVSTNNEINEMLDAFIIKGRIKVAVVDSWGNRNAEYTIFDELNRDSFIYGKYLLDIDYTSLAKESLTYSDLVLTNADVLMLSNSWANGQFGMNLQYTDSEITAIKQYLEAGHGLIGTGGTLSELVPNNAKLAPLFGIKPVSGHWSSYDDDLDGELRLIASDDILTRNVSASYEPGSSHSITGLQLDEVHGAVKVANGEIRPDIFVSAYKPSNGTSVYFSHLPEYRSASDSDKQFLYNAFVWTYLNKGKTASKDVRIYNLQYPSKVRAGTSSLVNGVVDSKNTVKDEITVLFYVNGKMESSKNFIFDKQREENVSFNFKPTTPGIYDIVLGVAPQVGERFLIDNKVRGQFIVPSLEFTDNNSESLIDLNNDSFYDLLAIDIGVKVIEPGRYDFSFDLTSFLGADLASSNQEIYLTPQDKTARFFIYLPKIKKFGLNGPYKVANLRVFGSLGGSDESVTGGSSGSSSDTVPAPVSSLVLLDSRDVGFTTKAYKYIVFQDSSSIVTNRFSDYGLDSNKNGLYNFLMVNVSINITRPGEYELHGALLPFHEDGFRSIEGLSIYSKPVSFTAQQKGIYNVTLLFDGVDIRKQKFDGSYLLGVRLASLLDYGNGESEYIDETQIDDAYKTSAYRYLQFEKLSNIVVYHPSFGNVLTVGSSNEIKVPLSNEGSEDVGPFSVNLLDAQGKTIQIRQVEAMLVGSYSHVSFNYTPTSVGIGKLKVFANVSDDRKDDNLVDFEFKALAKGPDLEIYTKSGDTDFIINEPGKISFVIYNRGSDTAKKVRVVLSEMFETVYEDGEQIVSYRTISTKRLNDIPIDQDIESSFDFTPRKHWTSLRLVVITDGEQILGDNVDDFSLESIIRGADVLVYLEWEQEFFVKGSPTSFAVNVYNRGTETSSPGTLYLSRIKETNKGAEVVLLAQQSFDSLSPKNKKNLIFNFVPSESDEYVNFLINASVQNDVSMDNNIYYYSKQVAPQSKLVNFMPKALEGTISISIQKLANGRWVALQGKSFSQRVSLKPQEPLKLDELFNSYSFSVAEEGRYRIYAKFTDLSGKVEERTWEFNSY